MPLALITGASSGLGRDLAHIAVRHGYDVVLVARTTDKLNSLAAELRETGGRAHVLPTDLSRPGSAAEVFRKTQSIGPIDILVNCAGFGNYAPFASQPWGLYASMLQVNIVSLSELTHVVLSGMVARRSGRILNFASTAAFQPAPTFGVYAATKAYILSLSEALHEELRGTGVTVTAACPGATATGFQATANTGRSILDRYLSMESRPVAEAAWDGMMRGRAVVVPGWFNKLNGWFIGAFPRILARKMAAFSMKPR